jgi:hypothetical protein
MIILERPGIRDEDPTIRDNVIIATQTNNNAITTNYPLEEGEFVIIKDDPNAKDWYCAEIRKILADRIEVNYYTTITSPLTGYEGATLNEHEDGNIFENMVLR